MSADEDRSHFGMWAILAAPLIAGNDISSMSETTKAILTNADVIAVNQDPLGKQATLVATPGSNLEVWSKQMSGINACAVALFNRSGSAASMTVQWSDIGPSGRRGHGSGSVCPEGSRLLHRLLHGDQRPVARHRHAEDHQYALSRGWSSRDLVGRERLPVAPFVPKLASLLPIVQVGGIVLRVQVAFELCT